MRRGQYRDTSHARPSRDRLSQRLDRKRPQVASLVFASLRILYPRFPGALRDRELARHCHFDILGTVKVIALPPPVRTAQPKSLLVFENVGQPPSAGLETAEGGWPTLSLLWGAI